jgi:hypothetical protein
MTSGMTTMPEALSVIAAKTVICRSAGRRSPRGDSSSRKRR